jgi:5-formyltetrahydrofolate cyclo-ligase
MLPEHSRIEMDFKISEQFFNTFDFTNIKLIHSYLPIKNKIEVDTVPILSKLSSEFPQIKIALPYTIFSDHTLKHFYWKPGDELIENRWGIPEPDSDRSVLVDVNDIDMVIVPLLAYDLKGHRVGYGAGYYDRFLSDCKDETLIVGLSAFAPEDQWIKSEEYDIGMDYCVTPENVYEF